MSFGVEPCGVRELNRRPYETLPWMRRRRVVGALLTAGLVLTGIALVPVASADAGSALERSGCRKSPYLRWWMSASAPLDDSSPVSIAVCLDPPGRQLLAWPEVSLDRGPGGRQTGLDGEEATVRVGDLEAAAAVHGELEAAAPVGIWIDTCSMSECRYTWFTVLLASGDAQHFVLIEAPDQGGAQVMGLGSLQASDRLRAVIHQVAGGRSQASRDAST
jgi:hypothetical protein